MKASIDYIAGFVDGEGTITLSYNHKGDCFRAPVLSIPNTERYILTDIQSVIGGYISSKRVYSDKHTPSFVLKLVYDNALAAMQSILPAMHHRLKIYRVKLLLSRYKVVTPRNGKYSDAMIAQKLEFESAFFQPLPPS